MRSGYLARSLGHGTNQERAAILRFIVATSNDEALSNWAKAEMKLVQKQTEDEKELQQAQIEQAEKSQKAISLASKLPPVKTADAPATPSPEERCRPVLFSGRSSTHKITGGERRGSAVDARGSFSSEMMLSWLLCSSLALVLSFFNSSWA